MRTARSAPELLDTRVLNRALLARQLLLRRTTMGVPAALEHLVGIQAQVPDSPYIALWSRLAGFAIPDLARLVQSRRAVRIVVMRSTIHLVTSRDCLPLRSLMQPAVERGLWTGQYGRALKGLDREAIATAGRALVDEQPRRFADIGAQLRRRWPDRDPMALAMAVRGLVPLVQVPPRGIWGSNAAPLHTSAGSWLLPHRARTLSIDTVVLRYLEAFGPASARDFQEWSGLTGAAPIFEKLRRRLRAFKDDNGRELLDLPEGRRPRRDVPAPPRFLPEFDNVLLGHSDRTRIIADRHRTRTFAGAGLMAGTVLIDGFVGARWRLERVPRLSTLVVEPFDRLAAATRAEIEKEGERLLNFFCGDAAAHDVRFARR